MPEAPRTATTLGEATAVVGICFGLFIFASIKSVLSGFKTPGAPFSDGSLLWLGFSEIVLGGIALALLARRGYAIASLFFRPSAAGTAWGLALFFAGWLASSALVVPFLPGQGTQPIDEMLQGAKTSLPAVLLVYVVNATFEEVLLLGFLLRGLMGNGLSFALGLSLLVRVLYHLYQGPLGAMSVLGMGLVFGLYYIRFAQLWPPVFAHMLFDVVGLAAGET